MAGAREKRSRYWPFETSSAVSWATRRRFHCQLSKCGAAMANRCSSHTEVRFLQSLLGSKGRLIANSSASAFSKAIGK